MSAVMMSGMIFLILWFFPLEYVAHNSGFPADSLTVKPTIHGKNHNLNL